MDTSISNLQLVSFAEELIAGNEDKIITESEIENFVDGKKEELGKLALDTTDVIGELKDLLKKEGATEADDTKETTETDKKSELEAQIKDYEAVLEDCDTKSEILAANLNILETELAVKESEYAKLEEELSKESEAYKQIIDKINKQTETLEQDAQAKQKRAAYQAMADFDPEGDVEWDDFLAGYLEDAGADIGLMSGLNSLIKKSDFKANNLKALGIKLGAAAKNITDLQTTIAQTKNDITNVEKLKETTTAALDKVKADLDEIKAKEAAATAATGLTGAPAFEDPGKDLTADEVLKLVSEDELKLAEEMGVDLYEKLPDGEPRFIFAQGKTDGKYHIYDMANWNENGDNSLVRLKYGYEDPSFCMIECGSGGITPGTYNKLSDGGDCEDSNGTRVYYLNSCNDAGNMKACYETWSPLSFDLNGDGVKTSDRIVDFDIDGDGVVDKINDSADAVLVFDKDGDGISGEDGSECFGDSTDLDGDGKADGYKDGFEALKALAKKEGLINGKDDNVLDEKDLAHLEETYGLKIKAGGYSDKASSLSDVGITEINLADTDETTLHDNFDGNGNQLMTQKGATFKINGEEREYADIWHKKLDESDIEEQNSKNPFSSAKSEVEAEIAKINSDIAKIEAQAQEAIEKSKETMRKTLRDM